MGPNRTAKILIACVAGCISIGCHKKQSSSNNAITATTYDFSVSGNTLTGYAVSFQSTAPATSTFLWSFGDGATSAAASPSHVYGKVDSFTVTMTVNQNSGTAVSKTIYISTPPVAANLVNIGGLKYWHGYVIADFQSATAKDTISADTDQFSVTLLNTVTITAKDDTLSCYYTDTVNKVYYFHHVFSDYSWREIAWYYGSNSYFYTYQPDQGGDPKYGPYSSATVLWTP